MDIITLDSHFTQEEVDFLLSFKSNFNPSGIRIRGEDTFTDYRISENSYSSDLELKSFLINKLSELNIVSIPSVEYLKYTVGSKFKIHRDRNDVKGVFTYRYRTLIIQLVEGSDYRGGDLIVEGNYMNRKLGSVIMFNSKYLHEVTEVTEGIRFSLCLFLTKDNFKSNLL